jgi:hypothetical protein
MFRSPYDVTPNQPEEKMRRDAIRFPFALPANSQKPIHDMNFVDRQFINDRKQNDQLPVQNNYMQQYQIHQLQQRNYGYNAVEQTQVDKIMQKKIPSDGNLLDRNRDDAILFGRQIHQPMPVQFMSTPRDTRKEKIDLNNEREPMAKVLGAPPKYSGSRNI